ncbi:MAG: protein-methionine-sulfoxide reductase heme-binding subunit MsrQ [Ectothiorhodospiraceae bacterium]|jgi:sulfoxide reductase heme-binding subunit YedZ
MAVIPAQLPPRRLAALKIVVFVACLVPAALVVFDLFTGALGVNPVEAMIRRMGDWGLRFLLATLAVTPLRLATGAAWLIRLRRMLGLFAFTYVALHFGCYVVFEQSGSLVRIAEDVVKRPYILVGFTALVMLIPLAATSTQGWMRRLGRRWKQLHRLVYAAGILGVFHFFMLIKADDYSEPFVYAGLLAALLGYRVLRLGKGRLRRSQVVGETAR